MRSHFSRLKSPASSAFLYKRHAPTLWSSSWLCSRPSPKPPHLSCAEGPRLGCSTPVGASPGQSKRGQLSYPASWTPLFWWNLGNHWFSGQQSHTTCSCYVFHLPGPPADLFISFTLLPLMRSITFFLQSIFLIFWDYQFFWTWTE